MGEVWAGGVWGETGAGGGKASWLPRVPSVPRRDAVVDCYQISLSGEHLVTIRFIIDHAPSWNLHVHEAFRPTRRCGDQSQLRAELS